MRKFGGSGSHFSIITHRIPKIMEGNVILGLIFYKLTMPFDTYELAGSMSILMRQNFFFSREVKGGIMEAVIITSCQLSSI